MPDSQDCPYCWKTFRSAGSFEKHLRISHAHHAGDFYNRSQTGLRKYSLFLDEGSANPGPLEPDNLLYPISTEEAEGDDSESDAESEFDEATEEPDGSQSTTRREIYENSGRPYGSVQDEEKSIRDLLQKPWYPFRNAIEFKLARFFLTAKVSWGGC